MLPWLRRKSPTDMVLGLSLSDRHLSLAQMTQRDAHPFLAACSRHDVTEQSARDILSAYVAEQGIEGGTCNALLAPRDYNLYLVEAPAVERSELASAVRWKVKDLLDMPAEDAAIDIFPVPEDAFQGRSKMLYVVAALRSRVKQMIDLVHDAGLQLNAIDIPELAMRNISRHFADDQNGLATMALKRSGSSLNLTRKGELYLTRKINTQVEEGVIGSGDWEALRDRLVLEIQRSLDYYESQMGQNPVSRLLLAPRGDDDEQLAASLDEAMAVSVGVLDHASQLPGSDTVTTADMRSCILAIGAAMRDREAVTEGAA